MVKSITLPVLILGLVLSACGAAAPDSAELEGQKSPDTASEVNPESGVAPSPTEITEESPPTDQAPPELLGPAPRTAGTMYFDPIIGRVVLASGYSCKNTWSFNDMDLDDVWTFNMEDNSWERMGELDIPNPYNSGYDAESERLIFLTFNPIETWAYDPISKQVQNMEPEDQPPDTRFVSFYIWGSPLAYDSESDRLILFGGSEQPGMPYSETWAYDYNTNTWENMQPESSPSERAFHSMVYDNESDRVILWGGDQEGGEDNKIWAYDYNTNTWESLENINGPEQHWERFGMVYHPPSDRIFIYSSFRAANGLQQEIVFDPATWSYDYNTNTWEQIVTETNPGTRMMYSMAYDEIADKVVIFSGEQTSKYANDLTTAVWLFDPATLQWSDVSKELVGCPE